MVVKPGSRVEVLKIIDWEVAPGENYKVERSKVRLEEVTARVMRIKRELAGA